jgi:hypothetical protein
MKVYDLEQGPDGTYVAKRVYETESIDNRPAGRKKKKAPIQDIVTQDTLQEVGRFFHGLSIIAREVKKITK